jgi:hypothetical protein
MPLTIIHPMTDVSSSSIHRALLDMDCSAYSPTRSPVYHQGALAPRWLVGIHGLLTGFSPTITIAITRLPSGAL